MAPDVNVLIAAFRKDHAHHVTARAYLAGALADRSTSGRAQLPLRLLPPAVAGFLRLVTNPKVFVQPDRIEDAVAFIDALLDIPGVETVAIGEEWPVLRQLCLEGGLRGNAIPDAWLAALVLRLGDRLVTFDRGMKKLLRHDRVTVLS